MAGSSKEKDGSKPPTITFKDGIGDFIAGVVDDCLYNIIHDIVSSVHASEKKLRMQSAAIQVENVALVSTGQSITPSTSNPSTTSKPIQTSLPAGTYSTGSAHYDNGRVTIQGNIFRTQKENFCPSCKLPRLSFPLTGSGARIPDDLNKSYCTLHPFIQKPGHDIYGNPFPVDAGKTKKEREALRKLERQEKDNTPGSTDTGNADADSAAGDPSVKKLMAGGKGATYVPWHTCPNCKRSLLITKFAQHLEKCMGIGGRPARNTAAARLSGINGSTAGSTQGSRVGTPTPSQANGKRDADLDSDREDGPPKKKFKKEKKDRSKDDNGNGNGKKSSLERKDSGPLKLKLKMTDRTDSSKWPPSKDKNRNDRDGSQKRDREDTGGGDETPKKKMRIKESSTLPEITAGDGDS